MSTTPWRESICKMCFEEFLVRSSSTKLCPICKSLEEQARLDEVAERKKIKKHARVDCVWKTLRYEVEYDPDEEYGFQPGARLADIEARKTLGMGYLSQGMILKDLHQNKRVWVNKFELREIYSETDTAKDV